MTSQQVSQQVIFDVGGTIFKTTPQTANLSPYLACLISGVYRESAHDSAIFIDRDPSEFKHVLRLLRDPNYAFPRRFEYCLEFYGIDPPKEELIDLPLDNTIASDIAITSDIVVTSDMPLYDNAGASGCSAAVFKLIANDSKRIKAANIPLKSYGTSSPCSHITDGKIMFEIPHHGDMMNYVYVEIRFEKDPKVPKKDIIKQLSMSCDPVDGIIDIGGKSLEYYNNINYSTSLIRYQEKMYNDNNIYCAYLPVIYDVFPISTIIPRIRFTIELNVDIAFETTIHSKYLLLDIDTRNKLNGENYRFQYMFMNDIFIQSDIDTNMHAYYRVLAGLVQYFIIYTEHLSRIKNISILANGVMIIDMSERKILQDMLLEGLSILRPIYVIKLDNLDMSRLTDIRMTVSTYDDSKEQVTICVVKNDLLIAGGGCLIKHFCG